MANPPPDWSYYHDPADRGEPLTPLLRLSKSGCLLHAWHMSIQAQNQGEDIYRTSMVLVVNHTRPSYLCQASIAAASKRPRVTRSANLNLRLRSVLIGLALHGFRTLHIYPRSFLCYTPTNTKRARLPRKEISMDMRSLHRCRVAVHRPSNFPWHSLAWRDKVRKNE